MIRDSKFGLQRWHVYSRKTETDPHYSESGALTSEIGNPNSLIGILHTELHVGIDVTSLECEPNNPSSHIPAGPTGPRALQIMNADKQFIYKHVTCYVLHVTCN